MKQLINNTLYTAEYDGYLRCSISPDNYPSGKVIVLKVNGEIVAQENPSTYNTNIHSTFVKKGSTYMFEAVGIPTGYSCWFFPLSKPM